MDVLLFCYRLLLSIDRRKSVADAVETVSLAEEYSTPLSAQLTRVVGIDLSGNPKVKLLYVHAHI